MKNKIYSSTRLRDEISISEIVTVHYFEFSKDYKFGGEAHDFWELVYVDNGELTAISDTVERPITKGEMIFHSPGEWHSLQADGTNAAAAIIISFNCNSAAARRLCGRKFSTGNTERILLSDIIREAQNAFDTPLSDLVTPKLNRKKEAVFGAEQLIKINLCKLIINLLREEMSPAHATTKRNLDQGLFGEITEFLKNNLDKSLSLEDISHHAGISKTALKHLFSQEAGCGACEYFIRLKIDRAKTHIRENNYNFTQIAEMLGYSSVHYFSAQFKARVNMSPTEYASSIKALTNEAKQFNS